MLFGVLSMPHHPSLPLPLRLLRMHVFDVLVAVAASMPRLLHGHLLLHRLTHWMCSSFVRPSTWEFVRHGEGLQTTHGSVRTPPSNASQGLPRGASELGLVLSPTPLPIAAQSSKSARVQCHRTSFGLQTALSH